MTDQDKDTQAGEQLRLTPRMDEPWSKAELPGGGQHYLRIPGMEDAASWPMREEVIDHIVALHNARLASQDAQDGEWCRHEHEDRGDGFYCKLCNQRLSWGWFTDNEIARFESVPSLTARVKELEQERERLRTPDYTCTTMCEVADLGGTCRCSQLTNELPAAEARVKELEQERDRIDVSWQTWVDQRTKSDRARIEAAEARAQRLEQALRENEVYLERHYSPNHPALVRARAALKEATDE